MHEHVYGTMFISPVVEGTVAGGSDIREGYTNVNTSGGGNHSHTFTPSVNDDISVTLGNGDTETRPKNFTTKIWKRTA